MKWVVRIVGGFAGVLLLGVVLLVAMGHRANANRMRGAVEVNAPPDRVWIWLNEPEKLKQWVSWLVEIRGDDPSHRGVGARNTWVMRDENNRGQLMEIHGTCAEYVPPTRMVVTLSTPGVFDGDQTYQVADLGNSRSRVEIVSTYRFSEWFPRLMEPLVSPMAEKKLVGDMARLKSLVEAAPK